jgi:hypothetical protein
VVAGLFVVLLVVGVVRGVVDQGDGSERATIEETRPSERRATTNSTVTTSTLALPAQDSETTLPESRGEDGEALARPVGPGLPAALAEEVQAVATEVLRADVTGEGRDRFGEYWGEGLYRPCCRDVVVHGAVARAMEGREGAVVVSMVWSAERLDAGPPRKQVETDVYLVERGGQWAPIRPAEGGG